jgi:transcriptional regulator with XRE-family HTH domain
VDQRRPWATQVAAEIGERVAFYRDRQGLSAQQLAARCAALGMPSLSRVVITKLENKRREVVSTAELQVLAAALGVPAVLLLFPLGYAEAVEVLPGRQVDPWAAIGWFAGNSEDPADPGAEPQMGTRSPILLWAEHRQYDGLIPVEENWQHLRTAINALRRVREIMTESGLTPPELHPATARILAEVERSDGLTGEHVELVAIAARARAWREQAEADDGAR